jgi:hypothetical protein
MDPALLMFTPNLSPNMVCRVMHKPRFVAQCTAAHGEALNLPAMGDGIRDRRKTYRMKGNEETRQGKKRVSGDMR